MKFKELNQHCIHEKGSAFYTLWREKAESIDAARSYLENRGLQMNKHEMNKTTIEIEGPWPKHSVLKKVFESAEDSGFDSMCPFGERTVDSIKGLINEGKFLRVRNGITMDSGSSVFVMPVDWLEMFELKESEGQRNGQTYVAAAKDGLPIKNEGERAVKFYTKPSLDSSKRLITFQAAKVNKILASIAGFCDANCEVLFRKKDGTIFNLETGEETHFRRVGNIYVMDAYIPNPDYVPNEMDVDEGKDTGFTRQGAR